MVYSVFSRTIIIQHIQDMPHNKVGIHLNVLIMSSTIVLADVIMTPYAYMYYSVRLLGTVYSYYEMTLTSIQSSLSMSNSVAVCVGLIGSPSNVNFNFVMEIPKAEANAVIAFWRGSV